MEVERRCIASSERATRKLRKPLWVVDEYRISETRYFYEPLTQLQPHLPAGVHFPDRYN